jgi:hypothetical protein
VRWKLLVGVCLVTGLVSYGASSARSISQSAARAAPPASHPLARGPLRFLAVRALAHGTLPRRRTFTITGERYRFSGRAYFTLAVSINRPGVPPGGGGGAGFNPSQSRGVLAFTFMTVCGHHPYAVVLGLLRRTSDTVVARRGRGMTVLAGPPSELIVRGPDGKRVLDQKFPSIGPCPAGAVVGVI